MTKSEGKCIFCGTKFTYGTTTDQMVDHNLHGGDMCPNCDARGLGIFVGQMKDAVTLAQEQLVKQFAAQIGRVASETQGDWWSKTLPLFKAFCGESLEVKFQYGESKDGHGAFVLTTKSTFSKDGRLKLRA